MWLYFSINEMVGDALSRNYQDEDTAAYQDFIERPMDGSAPPCLANEA